MAIPANYTVTAPEKAKKPGICGICNTLISVGHLMVICRYGAGASDWVKAHAGCVKLPPPEPRELTQHEVIVTGSRGSHTVELNGTGIYYSVRKEMAEGVVEFLRINPEFTDWMVHRLMNDSEN